MTSLRKTVLIVALLNLGWFGVEFLTALRADAVSLVADSADFLEDAAINLLIFAAVGWSVAKRAKVGMALAAMMLVPGLAFLWTLIGKYSDPSPPMALTLTLVGLGSLTVNVTAALLIARHRKEEGSLTSAAYLSARNDALANLGIIAAGLLTAYAPSVWPDLVVGLAIAAMNLDSAAEVWHAARREAKDARA